ncbi:hypothetical protein [Natronoglomus mannanivorans]|uniref:Uncharacterized protein n=1 Tax=Natronoglomus mannanivorans TaxID=2979990 RepID=A0AAP2Z3J7_9EURY|nr:hypothetical protein [Halobacteria archaeon AArc-xg1-1]
MAVLTVAIAIAMGMGMGAGMQDSANETDGLSEQADNIIDRNDPADASDRVVEIVEDWATDDRLDQLGDDQRDRVESWLEEARGSDDRDDQGEENPINPENCERIIDSETCVTEWSYATDGTFTLTFEALEETTVGLTEASDWDEDSERIAYAEHDLEPGETTVTFSVFETQGAGVGFMTAAAREQGSGAVISVGQHAPDPFRHFGGTSGLFSGVGLTVLLALVGAYLVVREESSGVVRASA